MVDLPLADSPVNQMVKPSWPRKALRSVCVRDGCHVMFLFFFFLKKKEPVLFFKFVWFFFFFVCVCVCVCVCVREKKREKGLGWGEGHTYDAAIFHCEGGV